MRASGSRKACERLVAAEQRAENLFTSAARALIDLGQLTEALEPGV